MIKWISTSYRKVKGNEDSDKLAKKAAEGHSSAMALLSNNLKTNCQQSHF